MNYCFPEMCEEAKRLVSFQQYPILSSVGEESMSSRYNSPLKLSNAGFFRQVGSPSDQVTCFACSVSYHGWNGESPLAVHRLLNPICPFLNEAIEDIAPASAVTPQHDSVRRRLFETPDSQGGINSAVVTEQQSVPRTLSPICGGNENLFESHRLLSFVDPASHESEEWAVNGFIYQPENNIVKCVFCGVESNFNTDQPPVQVHRTISINCPFVRYIDVGNISRELENAVKLRQLDHEMGGHAQRSVAYLHPQFEDEDTRMETFEYWPCLPQTDQQMADAGFYFTGCSDKVVCFACGCSLRKWRPSAVPWVEHARQSPTCQFVREKKGEEFIQQAAEVTEVLTACDPPQKDPVRQEGPVRTVIPGRPHLDMSAIAAAMECNYSIEQIREAVLRFFMLSRGRYPNTAILFGLLQATDKNFTMLQQQRDRIHHHQGELQKKDGELQREKEELQREREQSEEARREREMRELETRAAQCQLVREQQTHLALVEGQAAVIQRHVQEIRNREQQLQQRDLQTQNYQQQLQQRDHQLQQHQQLLYIAQHQLDNQTLQLDNNHQLQDNQAEMIRRLGEELQRLGRDPREIPDDEDESTTPPGVNRCKVCLSEEAQVLFRPCRHVCCGTQCAPQFIGQGCPICRTHVQEWELIFIS